MTEQIIGKVMMTFKGDYDATKQYDYLDVVTDQGSSFVCLSKDVTSKPSELSSDWQLIAKVGATPDTTTFALKTELPDLTPYALKTEIPTIPSDLVHTADLKTVSDIANNAKSEADSNSNAIADKADKGEIPTSMGWDKITGKPQLATLSDIPTMPDLSGYATVSSLIDYAKKSNLDNYYTKTETDTKLSTKADQAEYQTLNDKVDGMKIGGRNLVAGTAEPYTMGYGIPNTTWQNGYAYESLPTKILTSEILPQNDQFFANLVPGQEYTQTIWFETDADVKKLNAAITWFTNVGHDEQPAKIIKVGENSYKLFSTYTWPGKTDNNVRLFDIFYLQDAFDLSTGTYIKFGKLKLEEGNVSTDWTPAPEDFDTKLDAKADKSELVNYAKKSDIPASADLSGYATISSLIDYVKKTDLPDFTLFAKKSDIPTIPTDLVHTSDLDHYAKKSDIPVEQDLSNYAKKDDLNKYVTNETYSQNKTSLENTIQNLRTSLSNQNQVQTITSGTLADLATTQGSYHYEIDCSPSDSPVADWGLCDVIVGSHYAKQIFVNSGNKSGDCYVRIRDYDGNWSDWREITAWS